MGIFGWVKGHQSAHYTLHHFIKESGSAEAIKLEKKNVHKLLHTSRLSTMTQQVKNPPAVQETQEMWVQSLACEDPLGEEMATHSSLLAALSPLDRKGANKVCVEVSCLVLVIITRMGLTLPRILLIRSTEF